MSRHLQYHPKFFEDLEATITWHDQQKLGLGEKFYQRVLQAISSISDFTESRSAIQPGIRVC